MVSNAELPYGLQKAIGELIRVIGLHTETFTQTELRLLDMLDEYESSRDDDQPSIRAQLGDVPPHMWSELDKWRCKQNPEPQATNSTRVPAVKFLQQGVEPPDALFDESAIDWFEKPPGAFFPALARKTRS